MAAVRRRGALPAERLRGLTPEGFDALLAQLNPDRERAGEIYETIRRKLVRLFEWRGCGSPEDLTDETINRVARRLAEGVELRSSDPYGYFCGVAHLVYKEVLRRASREHRALVEGGGWPPVSFERRRRALRPPARLPPPVPRPARAGPAGPGPAVSPGQKRPGQKRAGGEQHPQPAEARRRGRDPDERAPHPGPPASPQAGVLRPCLPEPLIFLIQTIPARNVFPAPDTRV